MRKNQCSILLALKLALGLLFFWHISKLYQHEKQQASNEVDFLLEQPLSLSSFKHNNNHHLSKHTTINNTNLLPKNDIPICFVTAEFSDSVEMADQLPELVPNMIRDPPRHFVFTNLPKLPTSPGWQKILLLDLPYKRQITQSRWPKFLGWQHALLRRQDQCQIIFYGDAYLFNPQNDSAWQHFAHEILVHAPLMQNKQIGSNFKPVKGPGVELRKNARIGKISWQEANKTIQWLRAQNDYDPRIPVYKNALFGYNPQDSKFQALVLDFWQEYSKETASWRDQSYWAYFLHKHKITPLPFPYPPPLGPQGQRGHNGHIYATPPDWMK